MIFKKQSYYLTPQIYWIHKSTFRVEICSFIQLTPLVYKRSFLQWLVLLGRKRIGLSFKESLLEYLTPSDFFALSQCVKKITWEIRPD